jgi:hypothetical protein
MMVKTQDEILFSYSKRIILKKHSDIFRIDPHATFVAPVEDENSISIRHCEERPLRRGNLISYFFK